MVKLDKIYTRGGDSGQTGLSDGSRVAKTDLRIAAIGTVDEANSAIGVARAAVEGPAADGLIPRMLTRIQNEMFDLGADLSLPQDSARPEGALRITAAQVERLEREIDDMTAWLKPLASFVLPGGTKLAAALHLARALTRRAERDMVALAAREAVNPEARRYINRLSDHLFQMARHANDGGDGDVLWVPGKSRL